MITERWARAARCWLAADTHQNQHFNISFRNERGTITGFLSRPSQLGNWIKQPALFKKKKKKKKTGKEREREARREELIHPSKQQQQQKRTETVRLLLFSYSRRCGPSVKQ